MQIDGPALRRGLALLAGHPADCKGMLYGIAVRDTHGGQLWRFSCDSCAYLSEPFVCELVDAPAPRYRLR